MRTLIVYPEHWPKYYNACNEPCDMASGPCACGAWHTLDEWKSEIETFGLERGDVSETKMLSSSDHRRWGWNTK